MSKQATRWISKKGEDGRVKHISIQPYGESRRKAERTVDLLRKEGERSRLIETNRRLELYAPYRSVMSRGRVKLVRKKEPRRSIVLPSLTKTMEGLSRADVSVLLRNLRGHEVEVVPLSGGKYTVRIEKQGKEGAEDFRGFNEGLLKTFEEFRSRRLNRAHSTSQFQLHTTSNEERSYAESVKRYLEEDSTFRGMSEEKRRIVLGYVNIGLNGYFNTIEDEEGAVGKGAEWDYMDAREFPVRDIVKESQNSGSASHKSTRVGELVQEWMGTEGGRPKF